MKRKAFTFDITFLPIIRTSLTFTVHVLRREARKRREDRNQSHRGTDPLALSLWSIFKICFPFFRYHKRERLSHTGNFDTGHFHVGRGVRVRERPPRGERGRRIGTGINLCPHFNLRGAKTEERERGRSSLLQCHQGPPQIQQTII